MTDAHPVDVALENRLMGKGIYVTNCERAGTDLMLEYEVVTETDAVTSHEVGLVVRTLVELGDERSDWEPGAVRATSTTTDGAVRGTWRVETEWFDRLYDDLSEVEFSERVLSTISYPVDE